MMTLMIMVSFSCAVNTVYIEMNTNQLSLTVTVSHTLTRKRVSLLQFSNWRSFNCLHANF